jgi:hypothetical protein
MRSFIEYQPRPEDYWRGIVLFGRNVATYKFALARALLDLRPESGQIVTLDELAAPFAKHLCEHLKLADKQGTFQRSRFLDACRQANAGEIDRERLIETTVRLGFNNVIDAFHVVGREAVQERFYNDLRRSHNGIRMTDAFSKLLESKQVSNLPNETEARWRLVETAWELGLPPALIAVHHDRASDHLFVLDRSRTRRSITRSRDALSGYQKGHCFYCFDRIALDGATPPDVDHFFPHALKEAGFDDSLDGVWNLVLSCTNCNRGSGGKFDLVPTLSLLKRLHRRNEFLISSHHPLRETLMGQTGTDEAERRRFLNHFHRRALAARLQQWEPELVQEPVF